MPVVVTTRCPWTVTAVAPPFHMALTTAWMSCWWTTRRFRSWVVELMTSSGASDRVTVTPGPVSRGQSGRVLEPLDAGG